MQSRIESYHHHQEVDPEKLELLDDSLVQGNCIDLGCGNGLYGHKIIEHCDELLQVDILDSRAEEANGFEFLAADIEKLNLAEGSYDNVVAFDIMEHLDDDERFLSMVHRACKSRLILSVPNADDAQPREVQLTHLHHTDKTHRREYTFEGLRLLLHQHGFDVIEVRPHYNWGLFNPGKALAKPGVVPLIATKVIWYATRLFEKLGIFENRCIPDWYCVAERKSRND